MKVADCRVVVLCDDGKFRNLPHTSDSVQLGQRIEVSVSAGQLRTEGGRRTYRKRWIAVAAACCLLLCGLSILLMNSPGTPEPVAMVAIDINPSVELMVDGDGTVEKVNLVNEDAKELITEKELLNQPFYTAVQAIVAEAQKQGFLDSDTEKRFVFMSVVDFGEKSFEVDLEKLPADLREFSFEVYHADQRTQKQAKQMGLTVNKLVVYEQAKQRGITLSTENLRRHSIPVCLRDAGVNLQSFFGDQAIALQDDGEEKATDAMPKAATDQALNASASAEVLTMQVEDKPSVPPLTVQPPKDKVKVKKENKSGKKKVQTKDKSEDKSADKEATVEPGENGDDHKDAARQEEEREEDNAGGQKDSKQEDDHETGDDTQNPEDPDDRSGRDDSDSADNGSIEQPDKDDSQGERDNEESPVVSNPGSVGNEETPDVDDSVTIPGNTERIEDKNRKEDNRNKRDQDDRKLDNTERIR